MLQHCWADKNQYHDIDIACFGDDINQIRECVTISNQSVLAQFEEAMHVFRRYYQYEEIQGAERNIVERLPEEAFRETIGNAIIHREWDIPAHIKVSMYPNRIVVSSPGSLPVGLTVEEFLCGHISKLRNPVLGNVFFRLHYIEMFGTGVLRIKDAYQTNLVKPHFELTENTIVTHLPILTQQILMTDDERFVQQLIRYYGTLTSSELVSLTGFNKSKVLRLLKKLHDKDYLQIQGTGKGTRYKV